MLDRSEIEYRTLFSLCSQVMLALRQLPQPVIARVHGHATAAGCQLVASCDLAVASEAATFATPGVKIGLFCTTPMIPLVRAIAPKQAFEMLMTAKPISADEAQRRGLINRVVPLHQLDAAIQELTDAIVAASYEIVRLGKRAFYATATLDEADAYTIASEVMTANAMLPDAVEGIAAFLQKRKPVWPSTLTTEPTEPSSA
jgi:enoyl-CoA hydratase/carnithine racemase